VGSVENVCFPRRYAVLAVERFVDNRYRLSQLFHTLHTLHIMHIASTKRIHKLWITRGVLSEKEKWPEVINVLFKSIF